MPDISSNLIAAALVSERARLRKLIVLEAARIPEPDADDENLGSDMNSLNVSFALSSED
jgi:hypothetical protein